MLKLIAASLALAALAAVVIPAAPARAEIQYPWCALYSGMDNQATNCGFVTNAQCMAAISGNGGICYENPAYPAGAPMTQRRRVHQR
jgi:hypothetical protein